MKQLVTIYENREPITDSITVAEVFDKNHKDVLRDIKNLNCSEKFRRRNFALSSYKSLQNKEMPKYLITQDGFTILVMGFTGSNAMQFKEMYINEFNRMKDEIANMNKPQLPQTYKEALIALVHKVEENERLALENQQKQQLIEVQEPMVDSFKKFLDSDGYMKMTDFSKALGMGRNTLYDILRSDKIKVFGKDNKPYQRYMRYFKIVNAVKETSTGNRSFTTPLLSTEGCHYLKEKLVKAGVI